MEEPPPRGSGACGRARSMILYAERRRQRRSADNRRRTTTTTPGAAANSLEGCYPPPNVTFHINLLFRPAGDGRSGGAKLSDPRRLLPDMQSTAQHCRWSLLPRRSRGGLGLGLGDQAHAPAAGQCGRAEGWRRKARFVAAERLQCRPRARSPLSLVLPPE